MLRERWRLLKPALSIRNLNNGEIAFAEGALGHSRVKTYPVFLASVAPARAMSRGMPQPSGTLFGGNLPRRQIW